jgi:hypothetical protein
LIERVRQAVLAKGISNQGYWKDGKTFPSPDRKLFAKLGYVHDLARFQMFLVMFDKQGNEVFRTTVVDELPTEAPLQFSWNSVKWSPNDVIVLKNSLGKIKKVSVRAARAALNPAGEHTPAKTSRHVRRAHR